MFEIGLTHFLVLTSILFCLGFLTVVTRKNAIGILLGVELILNAATINFIAFSHYVDSPTAEGFIGGHIFAIFVITMAAAEAAVSLAIVMGVYNYYKTIEVDKVAVMRD
ncbi:MAG: NADH-quinone oxidoreductase subunit NuoK [Myxococcales bacterium]|nr:NADH-quinone oxidoreductase subunit NuoK [Myxococcales bacterium]|tara:strand:+ start:665 stop:991 length:327 start_codon:yes stop_codon:yes gene_type:complete